MKDPKKIKEDLRRRAEECKNHGEFVKVVDPYLLLALIEDHDEQAKQLISMRGV